MGRYGVDGLVPVCGQTDVGSAPPSFPARQSLGRRPSTSRWSAHFSDGRAHGDVDDEMRSGAPRAKAAASQCLAVWARPPLHQSRLSPRSASRTATPLARPPACLRLLARSLTRPKAAPADALRRRPLLTTRLRTYSVGGRAYWECTRYLTASQRQGGLVTCMKLLAVED